MKIYQISWAILRKTSKMNSVGKHLQSLFWKFDDIYGAISVASHETFADKFVKEYMWDFLKNL